MKTKGMILAVAVAMLAGCSNAPSNSDIRQAITKQFGDTPNDLSCSVDADATTKLRAKLSTSTDAHDPTADAIKMMLESKPEQTWVMTCSGGGHTSQLAVGKGADGKVQVAPAGAF
jgi:hypothetical protein